MPFVWYPSRNSRLLLLRCCHWSRNHRVHWMQFLSWLLEYRGRSISLAYCRLQTGFRIISSHPCCLLSVFSESKGENTRFRHRWLFCATSEPCRGRTTFDDRGWHRRWYRFVKILVSGAPKERAGLQTWCITNHCRISIFHSRNRRAKAKFSLFLDPLLHIFIVCGLIIFTLISLCSDCAFDEVTWKANRSVFGLTTLLLLALLKILPVHFVVRKLDIF